MTTRISAIVLAMAILLLIPDLAARAATERYNADLDHSIVGFAVAHMAVSKTTGRFTDYSGYIEMDPDAKTVKAIEAVIKTASVTTNHEKRDTHLRSPDFFHAEKFPTMTYTMMSYEKQGDTYMTKGDLIVLGVTKEIVLTGTFNGIVPKDPWGEHPRRLHRPRKDQSQGLRHELEQGAGQRRPRRRR